MCIKAMDVALFNFRDISTETSVIYDGSVIYRHYHKVYENYKQSSTLSYDNKGTARLGMRISNPPSWIR